MKLDFVKHRKVTLTITAALIVVALILLATAGLNFGIDFQGGTLLERAVPGQVTVAEVEQAMASAEFQELGMGRSFVQPLESETGDETVFLIRTGAFASNEQLRAVDDVLAATFGDVTERRTEVVGPVIGKELRNQAVWALLIAGAGMLLYISFRFEYRFAVVAILTQLHDVMIVLGIFSLLAIEINTSFIAAILTVVGYSINNTIVIFDRTRENLRLKRQRGLSQLVNDSINESLSRTINTSLTTLLIVLALFIFGGATIRDFTFALLIGVIAGTYSSLFLANPLWLLWRHLEERRSVRKPA